MEYIYAAMLLHKAGQKVEESSVSKVLEAAGAKPDSARVKALVAALDGVDIDKAIEKAAVAAPAAVASSGAGEGKAEAKVDEKKKAEEEKKSEEAAAAGLGALFG
ncbi:MAG: large subunit ribosomal protein L12 [archaeon GW2011_AR3]|nr:MAG: large subunit ribosomal protein L12 [archaeon GW2011_AR3]MBS3109034.1 50S ribosomal protein P1 [Candidatus Woesearchaeota archaeon]